MAGKRWRELVLTLNTYTERGREKGFYQARKPANRNWPGYDRAQVHEMSDVLESPRPR